MKKLLMAGLLALGLSAWGEETPMLPGQQAEAVGTGGLSCADVRGLLEQYGGPQRIVLIAWAAGYISGINRNVPGGYVTKEEKVDSVVTETIDWCASNPWQPFYRGIDSVLGISPQKMQLGTELPDT